MISTNLQAIFYLISGVLFILALRGLSSPETSRQGNFFGILGMLIAVKANVRTAEASRKGLAQGLSVAFKSGAITGLLVAGLALLAISIYYWALLILNVDSRELINALIRI